VGAVLAVGPGKSDEEDCFVLRDMGLYSSRLGLKLDGATADGIFM
jgi:CRISPR-associated endonuclease/helicase Cas3